MKSRSSVWCHATGGRRMQTVRPADSALPSRLFFSTFLEAGAGGPLDGRALLWKRTLVFVAVLECHVSVCYSGNEHVLLCQMETCRYATYGNPRDQKAHRRSRTALTHLWLLRCHRGERRQPAHPTTVQTQTPAEDR